MKLKLNAVLGKKHILLAALVLSLSLAVYLNWAYTDKTIGVNAMGEKSEAKNYGDAQFVENIDTNGEVFFAEAKQTRKKSREEAVTTLKQLIESEDVSSDQKTELALKTASMAEAIETEGKIENLIKAKGFMDCMVYYDTERVDVVVKTEGLQSEEVTRMKDIIIKEVDVPAENIAIIEVN
ncbi:MAG: SpoIIIAH-like family protein [Oscillospiraceae bacterium]